MVTGRLVPELPPGRPGTEVPAGRREIAAHVFGQEPRHFLIIGAAGRNTQLIFRPQWPGRGGISRRAYHDKSCDLCGCAGAPGCPRRPAGRAGDLRPPAAASWGRPHLWIPPGNAPLTWVNDATYRLLYRFVAKPESRALASQLPRQTGRDLPGAAMMRGRHVFRAIARNAKMTCSPRRKSCQWRAAAPAVVPMAVITQDAALAWSGGPTGSGVCA